MKALFLKMCMATGFSVCIVTFESLNARCVHMCDIGITHAHNLFIVVNISLSVQCSISVIMELWMAYDGSSQNILDYYIIIKSVSDFGNEV